MINIEANTAASVLLICFIVFGFIRQIYGGFTIPQSKHKKIFLQHCCICQGIALQMSAACQGITLQTSPTLDKAGRYQTMNQQLF